MAHLTVDLKLEQVRAIVHDLDATFEPVAFARPQDWDAIRAARMRTYIPFAG